MELEFLTDHLCVETLEMIVIWLLKIGKIMRVCKLDIDLIPTGGI